VNLNKIIQIIERKTFIYYNDINNNTLYIPRFIYEECLFAKINMTSKPKIIFNKNCYSITRNQIKELEEKSNFKGIEKIVYLEKENISPKLENTIFTYKDGVTDTIYIPLKYSISSSGNQKTILNKKCRAISINELEKIYNKKIYIITTFLKPEETEEIILCKTPDSLYIGEEDAISFGLNIQYRKKIKVDNKIYLQISKEEINLMEIISTKEDRKISLIEKSIIPKKR